MQTLRVTSALATFSMLCVASVDVGAFDYPEHVSITYKALDGACKSKKVLEHRANAADVLCKSERAKACFAHMVAIAADHAAKPEALPLREAGATRSVDDSKEFLFREVLLDKFVAGKIVPLDCRALLDLDNAARPGDLTSDWREALRDKDLKLVASSLGRLIEYGSLAADNASHFQPGAVGCWLTYFTRARGLDRGAQPEDVASCPTKVRSRAGTPSPLQTLADAAFALHFLEDAFSAGHWGLKRETREQEYAQAYHDDFNRSGRFLSNHTSEWHVYGDRRFLDPSSDAQNDSGIFDSFVPSSYLQVEWFRGPDGPANLIRYVEACKAGVVPKEGKELKAALAGAQAGETGEIFVLSLETQVTQSRAGTGLVCQMIDACPKTELILTQLPDAKLEEKGCKPTAKCLGVAEWTCDEAQGKVVDAAQVSLEFILLYLSGQPIAAASGAPHACPVPPAHQTPLANDPDAEAVFCKLPTRFRTIEQSDALKFSTGSINASTGSLAYASSRPADAPYSEERDKHRPYKPTSMRAWTFAIDRKHAVGDSMRSAFTFGLQLQDPGVDLLWMPARIGVLGEIFDTSGRLLNAFEVSGYLTPFPAFAGILRIAMKGSVGVDNVWQGRHNRYFFWSGGPSLSAHIGKHSAFVDVDFRSRSSADTGGKGYTRVLLGYRGASIALLQ